jgi:hypothetical protein
LIAEFWSKMVVQQPKPRQIDTGAKPWTRLGGKELKGKAPYLFEA